MARNHVPAAPEPRSERELLIDDLIACFDQARAGRNPTREQMADLLDDMQAYFENNRPKTTRPAPRPSNASSEDPK